jgi:hypothetical protein
MADTSDQQAGPRCATPPPALTAHARIPRALYNRMCEDQFNTLFKCTSS